MIISIKKKKKLKCFICSKKITILNFSCKCNNIFCNIHKYPEEHNCSYDYKKENRIKLENDLDNFKRQKIDHI